MPFKEFVRDVWADMKAYPKPWIGGAACMVILGLLFFGALQLA